MRSSNCVAHYSTYHKTHWSRINKNLQHFGTKSRIHFNESRLAGCAPRFALSLETKWGIIRHDVTKFVGHHTIVLALCKSGTGTKDILWKTLDLYKTKHPKHQRFIFVHVWYVLKKYFNGLTCEKKWRRHH